MHIARIIVKEGVFLIRYNFDIVQALKEAGYNTNYIRTNKLFSESTMSKFRRNDVNITLQNLDTLCDLLNMQPSEIITFDKLNKD